MSRHLMLSAAVAVAAVLGGCYEPAYIPPKPTPAEIVRNNARAEISREFSSKPELKKDLSKFLERLGDAETSQQLRTAWLAVYPDYPRVLNRTIDKSIHDFYWPVAGADGRVFVEGFREAAEDLVES